MWVRVHSVHLSTAWTVFCPHSSRFGGVCCSQRFLCHCFTNVYVYRFLFLLQHLFPYFLCYLISAILFTGQIISIFILKKESVASHYSLHSYFIIPNRVYSRQVTPSPPVFLFNCTQDVLQKFLIHKRLSALTQHSLLTSFYIYWMWIQITESNFFIAILSLVTALFLNLLHDRFICYYRS